ncbi:unnamed protein product, partial [Prorocentrum cordatum]
DKDKVPVGDACKRCWLAAQAVSGDGDVGSISGMYMAGEEHAAASVTEASATLKRGHSTFATAAVQDVTEIALDSARPVEVRFESELNSQLGGAANGGRLGHLRRARKITMATRMLESAKQIYKTQGQDAFIRSLEGLVEGKGLVALAAKLDGKQGQGLQTYADVLESEKGEKPKDDDDGVQPVDLTNLGGDPDELLVGVAASMPPPSSAPKWTSTGDFKTPSKPISAGHTSGGSGGSTEEPFKDGASAIYAGMDDGDDDVCAGLVQKWKARVPLADVMAGAVDGRAVSGLRKKIKRLAASDSTKSDATDLSVFEKLAQAAEGLRAGDLQAKSWDDALALVTQVVEDGSHVSPKTTMLELVSLKLESLDISHDAVEYIRVASPIGHSKFDPLDPALSSTDLPDKEKSAEFFRIVIKDHICRAISKGRAYASVLGDRVVLPVRQKSGSTLSHVIAAALMGSPYYQDQIEIMQRALPFAKKQLSIINTSKDLLSKGHGECTWKDLSSAREKLAMWSEGMPAETKSMGADLKRAVVDKINEFVDTDWAKAPIPSKEELHMVSSLVAEANVAFPKDSEMSVLQQESAVVPQHVATVDRRGNLLSMCALLMPDWKQGDSVSEINFEQFDQEKAEVETASRAHQLLIAVMETHRSDKSWDSWSATLRSLLGISPEPALSKRMDVVAVACSVLTQCLAIQAIGEAAHVVKSKGGLGMMLAQGLRVVQTKKTIELGQVEYLDLGARTEFESDVDWATGFRSQVGTECVRGKKMALETAVRELAIVQCGTLSGKPWPEEVVGQTALIQLPEIVKKATKGTQWKALADLATAVPRGVTEYRAACKWASVETDASLVGIAEAIAQRGWTTKAEASIPMKMTSGKNADLLRTALISEINELRAKLTDGAKEGEALHSEIH